MTGIEGIYAIFLLIFGIITLYLTFYCWNRRSNPDAIYISFLMLAVSIWSITGSFKIASIGISANVLWSQYNFFVIVFVGPLWLLFTLNYTINVQWLKKEFITLLNIDKMS